MTRLRDVVLERLHNAPPRGLTAMQIARPHGKTPHPVAAVEHALAELWDADLADGWPDGPWTPRRPAQIQTTLDVEH